MPAETTQPTLPWILLEQLIEQEDQEDIKALTLEFGARETARAIDRLPDHLRNRLFTLLEPSDAAHLADALSDGQAAQVLSALDTAAAADIVAQMQTDHQASVLTQCESGKAEEIRARLGREEDTAPKTQLTHRPGTAGALMSSDFLLYRESNNTQYVVNDMRENAAKYREYAVQYMYVVDDANRLAGVLPLRDLVLSPGDHPLHEVMIGNPLTVEASADLGQLVDIFEEHLFFGVPVVDPEGVFLGVVTRARVEEARSDKANQTYLKSSGIVGGEELRSMPTRKRATRRLSWLSVNIVLNILAASVIAMFEETIASVIALAIFLPIISDMSGCSGNQAVAVSMREIALGLARPRDLLHVWFKEVAVGIINGIVLGLLIAAVAWMWKGNAWLGLVVGAALCVNTIIAVSIGGTIPLFLKWLKMDPALASGPVLTTVTDLCGFLLVLGLATALLPYLV